MKIYKRILDPINGPTENIDPLEITILGYVSVQHEVLAIFIDATGLLSTAPLRNLKGKEEQDGRMGNTESGSGSDDDNARHGSTIDSAPASKSGAQSAKGNNDKPVSKGRGSRK